MKTYYVYILECSDKSYYTGFTSKLQARVIEHQTGKYPDSYTHNRRPIKLVFHAEFTNPNQAIESEKQIKKWSRAKKEALINNAFENLPNLSKKKFKD
ncbi:GIY-YIG nuclease family protein [Lacinutrix jangbogonensis]|uniref:GIY-YIG nuclease family protein n=1 Tax=Lacinutrix jangbogonensis TaxID=1469557 RepID=UPI00053EBE3F|nr:GIY-YIG nuclease family protein [Lacinutrix jangbogonensis]